MVSGRAIIAGGWRVAVLTAVVLLLVRQASAQVPSASSAMLDVPAIESVKRVDRSTELTPDERAGKLFIMKTTPHAPAGEAYVIITDHGEPGYLKSLERLAQHRRGRIVRVDDLGAIANDANELAALERRLVAIGPKYVAIAPRLESYRENMLLAMWQVLASLKPGPELDAFPALLLAPDAAALDRLITRSIDYKPMHAGEVRPFLVSQVTDNSSILGLRALQKMLMLERMFETEGRHVPTLIVRKYEARLGSEPADSGDAWQLAMEGPRRPVTQLPNATRAALDHASLLAMFGHGVPGMTCSLDVDAFRNVDMTNKLVLCGSCFSAAGLKTDFPQMQRGADGSEMRNERERFAMRAIENGAVVVYGHLRENGGFPQMFPVLEGLLEGLSVGEAYQRMMNAQIAMTGLRRTEFVLPTEDRNNDRAAARRNQLLYVVIGDPAITPIE